MTKQLLFLFFLLGTLLSCAPLITAEEFRQQTRSRILQSGPDSVHSRGISVVNGQVFTASNNGFVYQYNPEAGSYKQLSRLELPELRDIWVLSEDYFVALQSNDASVLLLSNKLVEQRIDPFPKRTFLDGIDINARGHGIVMGDPVDGMLQVALTTNYGLSWTPSRSLKLLAHEGEAGFAASGSNVQVINDSTFVFVTGGKTSRFFKTSDSGKTWSAIPLNFKSSEASGPFSMHFQTEQRGILVGGNYLEPKDTTQNCFLTFDGGRTWLPPKKTTSGYRSSVIEYLGVWYACGTNGIDFSLDLGLSWHKLSNENTFALAAANGKIYATMTKGRVLEITPPK